MLKGWMPRSNEGEDVLQLGGDFVLSGDRRLIYAHRSADPIDRPAAETLVEVMGTCVDSVHRR